MRFFLMALSLISVFALSGCASTPKEYYPIAGAQVKQDKQSAVWHCGMIAQQAYDKVVATGNDNFTPQVTLGYTANTQCDGNAYSVNCTTNGQVYDQSDYAAQKAGNDFAVGFMAGMKKGKTMKQCMAYNGYALGTSEAVTAKKVDVQGIVEQAVNGDVDSQNYLAKSYVKGDTAAGIDADVIEAYAWLSVLVDGGDDQARIKRDMLVLDMSDAAIRSGKGLHEQYTLEAK